MKKSVLVGAVSLILLQASGSIQAESVQEKTLSCNGCHGVDGNSMMPLFPKLADQNEEYLIKQLNAFKDGSRIDATMNNVVKNLSSQDIEDIALFYEQQTVTENSLPPIELDDDIDDIDDLPAEEQVLAREAFEKNKVAAEAEQTKLVALGQDIYRNGILDTEVSACVACHGPYGEGNKPASFPALQGQHADYLIKTLTDFKAGIRTHNTDNMMHMIAKKMTSEEIKATSYYMSIIK